jgi:hypothetical protein
VLPDFLREFHRLTAKAMNASQGQWENLWAAEPCSVVRLVTDEDINDKIAYVVANPVAAGLVRDAAEWPGLLLWGARVLRAVRPVSYFREEGTCPTDLPLSVEPPPARDQEQFPRQAWKERITQTIAARVAAAHSAMASKRRAFLGRAAVLASSFIQRARSYEERFDVVPTFAAKARSVRDRLRIAERDFRRRYRAALESWRIGQRDIVFPFGTWGLAVFHAATVAPPIIA